MTRRQHIQSIAMPIIVTGVIPAAIYYATAPAPLGLPALMLTNVLRVAAGLLALSLGLVLVANTIRLFSSIGQGTLAPWDPPRHLVVRGIYRHVRNPMISGVIAILLGEALLFDSLPLLYWFVAAALINAIYIPLLEEPGLQRRFGEDYAHYKQHVPRWLPRLTPWNPPAQTDS